MSTDSLRYTRTAIVLHWLIAALMIFMLFLGEDLIRVGRGGSLSDWRPTAHASFGLLVLFLSIARIAWRMGHTPPPPPPMPRWQAIASHATHHLFYVLIIAIPLTGWLAMTPYAAERTDGEMVTFFKLFSVNIWPNLGNWTSEAHEIGGTVAKVLLFLHVAAALKHQFWDRDGLLWRMVK